MEKKYPRIFKKAIKGSVGGRYLDKFNQERDFLLKGNPTDSSADVDQMIVEVYDEDAEKFFIKRNKSALVHGYLIEISDYEQHLDSANAVTDGDLKEMLKLHYMTLKARIEQFTSVVPLQRLLEFALEADKPIKTIQMIEEAVAKFDTTPRTDKFSSDNVTVRSI